MSTASSLFHKFKEMKVGDEVKIHRYQRYRIYEISKKLGFKLSARKTEDFFVYTVTRKE